MPDDQRLLDNLRRRRVPQIAGMYIGAMWLVIELGDWVSERFSLPEGLTSFVFVAMLILLPSVLLLAWNHGTPGRDAWTRTEKVLVPVNLLLAGIVIWFISPRIAVEAATETLTIEDETGVLRQFEVVRAGHHREIMSYFWNNDTGDEELDWLAYGLPVMFTYDINRVSPVVTAATPLDAGTVKEKLREQGHDRLVDVPRGLAVELSRERRSSVIVDGSFSLDGDQKVIAIDLIDTASGEVLKTYAGTAPDWLAAVDDLTTAVLSTWEIVPAGNQSDDPVREHFSASLDAIRYFVLGQVAIEIDGDYPAGIEAYAAALEIDPGFAEARGELSIRQYLSGNLEDARVSATMALRNSYRLSKDSEFTLKANRYFFDGDYERGERVLDIWVGVQPNNTRALQNTAQLARFRGTPASLDKAVDAYERLLELRPSDYNVYRQIAAVEQQRGDYDAAIRLLTQYLDFVPDSGSAHNQLAGLYQAKGDLDAAQTALEDAAILSDDPVESELGLVRLEARRGFFDEAWERLDSLQRDDLTTQQDLQVLLVSAELTIALGRIREALEFYDRASEVAEPVMPPAVRIITIEGQRGALLQYLGRVDDAVASLDAVAAQLQPPLSTQMNFIYAGIYDAAGDRDSFRRVHDESMSMRDQLPQFYQPLLELEEAQIRIWDGETSSAIGLIDRAQAMLGQSIIGVLVDNLLLSEMFVGIAKLYVEAGANDKAKAQLEDILRVYPSNAFARLVLARVLVAEGDDEGARAFLEEALKLWSSADEDFILLGQARDLLAGLGA